MASVFVNFFFYELRINVGPPLFVNMFAVVG